jgi:hypothetical protein
LHDPLEDDRPESLDLGTDLERLERDRQAAEDRRRTEELAQLRAVQGFD